MFDGRGDGGFMNTMLKMKIVVPAAGTKANDAGVAAPPRGGSTDPREFLAMRARQKRAQRRMRRWKLGLVTLGCVGMAALPLASPRWRHRNQARAPPHLPPLA